MTNAYLGQVRKDSEERFGLLQGKLCEAERLISEKACVYATGSFGRLEAGPYSDLDLFIVVDFSNELGKAAKPKLDGLEEIQLKYFLIQAVGDCGIARFDGGGRYLESHSITAFVDALGARSDDYQNTLTGRLLLLLESRPLLGEGVYNRLLENVTVAYFTDYLGKEKNFLPAFLVNDILRMWRTFCVNYEFNRKKGGNDGVIKNLKLKYSRMLTCYSAIIYLLVTHMQSGTVSPEDVKTMVKLTPTERLEALQKEHNFLAFSVRARFVDVIEEVLGDYAKFLERTHMAKDELLVKFTEHADKWREESYLFGQKFAEALSIVGEVKGRFDGLYRMILI